MNLRSTTPAQALLALSFVLISISLFSLALTPSSSGAVETETTEERIDDITAKIESYSKQVSATSDQKKQVSDTVEKLKLERLALQAKLDLSKKDLQTLSIEVEELARKIELRKEVLGTLLADQQIASTISPLEMLASSRSIGDYFDKRVYQDTVNHELMRSMDEITVLKKRLAVKQAYVKEQIVAQQKQVQQIGSDLHNQENLLAVSAGTEAKMVKVTKELALERQRLQNTQQQSMALSMGGAEYVTSGSISTPVAVVAPKPVVPKPAPVIVPPTVTPAPSVQPKPVARPAPATPTPAPVVQPKPVPAPPVVLANGGYPSYLNNCKVDAYALSYGIDPWGYGCRQCVSYTAWKVLQKSGRTAMYWGNANMWPASARARGYQTSSVPRAGSVGVMMSGPYGHVVWVESVNANGTINISQYNYWLPNKPNGGWGYYSEFRNVSPSAYQSYIYI